MAVESEERVDVEDLLQEAELFVKVCRGIGWLMGRGQGSGATDDLHATTRRTSSETMTPHTTGIMVSDRKGGSVKEQQR